MDSLVTDLQSRLEATKRELEQKTRSCQRHREVLQSKLRSQACEIDRIDAENSEQRYNINLLQSEVSRLKRAQRTNVQDLAHISAWLVSLAQAKGRRARSNNTGDFPPSWVAAIEAPAGAPRL